MDERMEDFAHTYGFSNHGADRKAESWPLFIVKCAAGSKICLIVFCDPIIPRCSHASHHDSAPTGYQLPLPPLKCWALTLNAIVTRHIMHDISHEGGGRAQNYEDFAVLPHNGFNIRSDYDASLNTVRSAKGFPSTGKRLVPKSYANWTRWGHRILAKSTPPIRCISGFLTELKLMRQGHRKACLISTMKEAPETFDDAPLCHDEGGSECDWTNMPRRIDLLKHENWGIKPIL